MPRLVVRNHHRLAYFISAVVPRQVSTLELRSIQFTTTLLATLSEVETLHLNTWMAGENVLVPTLWPALCTVVMHKLNEADDLSWLRALHYLRCLDVAFLFLKETHLINIGVLTSLQTLKIASSCMSKTGASALSSLVSLTSLDIGDNQELDDETLASLRTLTSLRTLEANALPLVTDAGVAALAALPKLQYLDLRLTKITGTTLERLTALKILVLRYCDQLTDGLRLPPALEQLDLSFSRHVTAQSAQRFASISTLREVNVTGCFSRKVLDSVRASLPLLAKFEPSLR